MKERRFERLCEGIYRLCLPFENIYTSVFALVSDGSCALLDSGSNERDVREGILPALGVAGFVPDMLLCSHLHGDHCGGVEALASAFPDARIGLLDKSKEYEGHETVRLSDGDLIFGRFEALNLRGHTADCLGVLDRESLTLLSCDCLQLWGIGRYGTSFEDLKMYEETLRRVSEMGLTRIIASHEYVPLGAVAEGEAEIKEYILECRRAVDALRLTARENPGVGSAELAELYNRNHKDRPDVWRGVFDAITEK